REAASRVKCQNNLKQLGLACHNYHDANNRLPPGYLANGPYIDGETDTAPGWGWGAYLLPYIEQDNLYRQLDFNGPIAVSSAARAFLPLLVCPSDIYNGNTFALPDAFGATVATVAPCSYAACVGGDESETTDPRGLGVFYRNSRTRLTDVTDGLSLTIFVGERAWSNANGVWVGAVPGGVCKRGLLTPCPGSSAAFAPAPTLVLAHSHLNNATSDTDGGLDDFSSRHIGGFHFFFSEAAARFLPHRPRAIADGGFPHPGPPLDAAGTRGGRQG